MQNSPSVNEEKNLSNVIKIDQAQVEAHLGQDSLVVAGRDPHHEDHQDPPAQAGVLQERLVGRNLDFPPGAQGLCDASGASRREACD